MLFIHHSIHHQILLYVNPTIHSLCIESKSAKKLKIVNTGLKMFEYNSRRCECAYRICQEGLSIIRKYMTKRVVDVPLKDYLTILTTQKQSADITVFTDRTQVCIYVGVSLQKQLENLEVGACVFVLDEESKKELTKHYPTFKNYFDEMGCCVWRGQKKYS